MHGLDTWDLTLKKYFFTVSGHVGIFLGFKEKYVLLSSVVNEPSE